MFRIVNPEQIIADAKMIAQNVFRLFTPNLSKIFLKKSFLKKEITNNVKFVNKNIPKIVIGIKLPRKILITEKTAPIKQKNINSNGLKFINLFTISLLLVYLLIKF